MVITTFDKQSYFLLLLITSMVRKNSTYIIIFCWSPAHRLTNLSAGKGRPRRLHMKTKRALNSLLLLLLLPAHWPTGPPAHRESPGSPPGQSEPGCILSHYTRIYEVYSVLQRYITGNKRNESNDQMRVTK